MYWDPESLVKDFQAVARFAGIELGKDGTTVESLPAPHSPPTTGAYPEPLIMTRSRRSAGTRTEGSPYPKAQDRTHVVCYS
jgi:hypothetical protein